MYFTETEFNELPDDLKEKAHDSEIGEGTLKEISDFSMIGYVNGLKNTVKATRGEVKDLKQLKKDQQRSIDSLRMEQQKIITKMKADGSSTDEQIAAVEHQHADAVATMEQQHSTALEAKDAEITKLNKKMEKKDRKAAATDAIGVADGNVELLRDKVMKQTRTFDGKVLAVDENGEVRLTPDGKEMTVTELLAEMRANPQLGGAFKSRMGSGNNSQPQHGDDGRTLGQPNRTLHRSQMTTKQKVEYVKAHGDPAFQALPL